MKTDGKNFLPISVNIAGKRILIVGGGHVALHKLKTLLLYTKDIAVLAPVHDPAIAETGAESIVREFGPDDLDGVFLVYACTNDRETNRRIAESAAAKGILCNTADDPGLSEFISPAIYKKEYMSVSVSSGGADVKKSVQWRNRIREIIESDISRWD